MFYGTLLFFNKVDQDFSASWPTFVIVSSIISKFNHRLSVSFEE